jgi:TolB-like protein/DNA-binding winged helix-turn-helix (wHTH) protein
MEEARTVVSFDRIEIDLDAHRLRRDGVDQPLEPRAFAVLALLVGAAGRVLERDQILDAVWGHAHVTPGTLNRIITLLRQALGESANQPRYLHTVYGVGYRFEIPKPPDPTKAPEPAHTPPVSSASRAWAWCVGAALVLLLGVALWFGRGPARPTPEPSATSSGGSATGATARPMLSPTLPVLAILPLRTVEGDDALTRFADGLTEELITQVARLPNLRVTSYTSAVQLRDAHQALPEIARRLRATHLLEGSVRQDGDRLRVSLRLHDGLVGRTLWSERFDRGLDDIFAMQDRITRAVADALHLGLDDDVGTTRRREDVQAYRRYLLARRRFSERPGGREDYEQALAEVEALVRDAPGYAPGWGLLGLMLAVDRPNVGAAEREERLARVERAVARALAIDPEEAHASSVRAQQACLARRWDECMGMSRRLVERFPSDSMMRHGHARRLAMLGHVRKAIVEIDEAIARDPLAQVLPAVRAMLLVVAGREEEAEAEIAASGLDDSRAMFLFNALWMGDCREALRRAERIPQGKSFFYRESHLLLAQACADPASWDRALEAIEASERDVPAGMHRYNFARLLLPPRLRDHDEEVRQLLTIQQLGYADIHYVLWRPGESGLRASRTFRDHVRSRGLLAHWRAHGWPDRCRDDGAGGFVCD